MRRPVLLLLLTAFLPLVVLSAGLGVHALQQEQAAIERDALERARRLSTVISRELNAQLDHLRVMSDMPYFDGYLDQAAFVAIGKRLKEKFPMWRALRLTNPDGSRIVDYPEPVGTPTNPVVDLKSHQRAVETQRAVIGRVLRGPLNRPGIAIRAPVIRDGNVKYVLSVVLEPDMIRDLLFLTDLPRDWVATVIDGEGYIAARTMGSSAFIGEQASEAALTARSASSGGIYEGLTLDGIATLSAFQRLSVGDWSVHIGVPRSVANAPLHRSISLMVAGAIVTLLLVAAFLSLLMREIRLRRQEELGRERALRLEALGRMTGGVAHDFNNLLMIIQGSAEGIKRKTTDMQRQQRYADAILTAAQRGVAITRQLLAFARRDSHEPTDFRLQDRAYDLQILLERSVHDGVQVSLTIPPEAWPIHADPHALEVALINLAVNASDAITGQGKLIVAVKNVSLTTGSQQVPEDGDYVAISVSDTGGGISADHIPHIFDPFYSTKGPSKGTGLGLSQVYGFAEQAGGSVTVSSKEGQGSLFTLYLPRGRTNPADKPGQLEPAAGVGRGNILLVEDNVQVAEVTADMLREAGFAVVPAVDAASAITLLRTGQDFDAVLSDVMMEGRSSGFELAHYIKTNHAGLPIVLMTGYSDALPERGRSQWPILLKPFGKPELVTALRSVMSQPAH